MSRWPKITCFALIFAATACASSLAEPPVKDDKKPAPKGNVGDILVEFPKGSRFSEVKPVVFGAEDMVHETPSTDGLKMHLETRFSFEDYRKTIYVGYGFEYENQQRKLTIVKPHLTTGNGQYGQSVLEIVIEGKSGKQFYLEWRSIGNFGIPDFALQHDRDDFIHGFDHEKHRYASEIEISLDDLLRYLEYAKPIEFRGLEKSKCYFLLRHNPTDNGSMWKMKAWTGLLKSNHAMKTFDLR